MSDALLVKEFTEESSGHACPSMPTTMNRSSAAFIIRMILSELDELACTVTSNERERDALLQEAINTRDKCTTFKYEGEAELIGAQFDALVDAWYYSLNCAAKHGVNMSRIFDVVHQSNMAKRDPSTGSFIRRDDGKVVKPQGWKSPDITGEIRRQTTAGSWTK
jgi:predicted HAD superfamily Cof-like phosphohydrolase